VRSTQHNTQSFNEDLHAIVVLFPVDPGTNSSLGGMAAKRASGASAVLYGTMHDNVMVPEVILSDGRIIRTGSGARI
jgi:D-lactate dehydrogenase (cytochrome)